MDFVTETMVRVPATWTPRWAHGVTLEMREPSGSEPAKEKDCSVERIVVMIRARLPAVHPEAFDLEPVGSAVVLLLVTDFARSPPQSPPRGSSQLTAKVKRHTFYDTILAMTKAFARLVADPRGSLSTTQEGVIDAARCIAKCLSMLQSHTGGARGRCVGCRDPPVDAPCVDAGKVVVEVQYNLYCDSGYTTINAVSILPPLREFHAPVLCRQHQQRFNDLLELLIAPGDWQLAHACLCPNSTLDVSPPSGIDAPAVAATGNSADILMPPPNRVQSLPPIMSEPTPQRRLPISVVRRSQSV